jgi:hypothetical protein
MSFVSTQTNEPSKKELTEAVKEVYKEKAKKEKSENVGKEKKKREPSLYNKFYKEKAAEIKEREKSLSKEERMTAKEMMTYIAKLWQEEKNSDNLETFEDAEDEPIPEPEPEPEPEPVKGQKKKRGKPQQK